MMEFHDVTQSLSLNKYRHYCNQIYNPAGTPNKLNTLPLCDSKTCLDSNQNSCICDLVQKVLGH